MSSGYLLLKNNQEVNEATLSNSSDANTSQLALQALGLGIWDGIALDFMLVMTIVVVKKLLKTWECGDKEGCCVEKPSSKNQK
jgi:hypothetical protein